MLDKDIRFKRLVTRAKNYLLNDLSVYYCNYFNNINHLHGCVVNETLDYVIKQKWNSAIIKLNSYLEKMLECSCGFYNEKEINTRINNLKDDIKNTNFDFNIDSHRYYQNIKSAITKLYSKIVLIY